MIAETSEPFHKVIKVNVLPSNSTHRYEVHKGEHGILYFAQTIADVAISSHNITPTHSAYEWFGEFAS